MHRELESEIIFFEFMPYFYSLISSFVCKYIMLLTKSNSIHFKSIAGNWSHQVNSCDPGHQGPREGESQYLPSQYTDQDPPQSGAARPLSEVPPLLQVNDTLFSLVRDFFFHGWNHILDIVIQIQVPKNSYLGIIIHKPPYFFIVPYFIIIFKNVHDICKILIWLALLLHVSFVLFLWLK